MSSAPVKRTRIPWLRFGAESAAIVLSILIAFAIDAWWDYRQDRIDEREALAGLEEEFAAFDGRLGRRALFYDSVVGRIEWLLGSSAGDLRASVGQFAEALGPMVGAPTFETGSGIRDGLVASGGLSVIRNDGLRSRLSSWERVMEETVDNERVVREFAGGVLIPFLAARGVPVGRSLATWRGDRWGLPRLPEAEAMEKYRSLVSDPEFRVLAAWRYDWAVGSATDFRRAQSEARAILQLIREELSD